MILKEQYSQILENIAASCAKARRRVEDVTLVAVTKSATPEQIKEIVELGHRHLGESRVQQLQQRAAQITEWLSRQQGKTEKPLPNPGDVVWHMIGHLQRNKVKQVMNLVSMIHSVDSLRLAEEVQVAVAKTEQPMKVFSRSEYCRRKQQVWRGRRRGDSPGGTDRHDGRRSACRPDGHGAV